MTTTERRARTLGGFLAVLIALTVAVPHHAQPQAADLVTQGRRALDADRIDEAIGLFGRAAAADAGNAATLAALGSARVRKARAAPLMERAGWVSKGLDSLDEAVERFPDAWIVYLVRGSTSVNLPPMFNKAGQAATDLGAVAAMKDRQPGAVAAWEKGRRLYPGAPEAAAIDRELRGL
jgi:hypothetical protein